ncbi:MAG: competence/damage-inducible protein A [Candidatus Marinimicrobia bacterium CG08_land_8_20_14_0_20_45_22]|nr:MAG: competence/damage-inducible protein A [Candidatus Marinimicrobia bacterium CG08_land_8_20_14_0_20_45_22]
MDRMKNAGVISIGNELLSGRVVNTNSTYISQFLKQYGISVNFIITIGDDKSAIIQAIDACRLHADLIFITGGLGPTHDDITKTTIAEYFNSKLVFHEDILNDIRDLFRRRGKVMSESNVSQAMIPDKAQIIPNPVGTAQGMKFQQKDKTFYVMPGVPIEMERILIDSVSIDMEQLSEARINTLTIHTTGVPESELYGKIENWISIQKQIGISILPHFTHIDLVLYSGDTDSLTLLDIAKRQLAEKLGEIVYGYDDETLEMDVANLLIDKKMTIAVAESCTGGLITDRLTNVSGSSAYFILGVVTYSNESKVLLINVNPETLKRYGAVSSETAKEMALGVRKLSGCDIGLSSTGIAGPPGGSDEKPVGLVHVGLSMSGFLESFEFRFLQDRIMNKQLFSQMALNQLRLTLLRE